MARRIVRMPQTEAIFILLYKPAAEVDVAGTSYTTKWGRVRRPHEKFCTLRDN